MVDIDRFCISLGGELRSSNDAFIINSKLPFLRIYVRRGENRLDSYYKAIVFDLHSDVNPATVGDLKSLFPIHADVKLLRGTDVLAIELNQTPEEVGPRFASFAFIPGGRPIEGEKVITVGINQGDFPLKRYAVAFFLDGGKLTVEKAELQNGRGTKVLFADYLYQHRNGLCVERVKEKFCWW